MPSFDIVSEIDMHELTNALDQVNREVGNRYDFKGSDAKIELKDNVVGLEAETEFQLEQMLDILYNKMAKRGIELGCLDAQEPSMSGKRALQKIKLQQGIDKELAKKIVKLVKDSKLKVQAAIQGEQVRVTGKKKDDLQQVIAFLKETDISLPMQYVNFRD
ncbi:MAG: YajQ family cyclic di-GMP-binding protein [Gammaproteobacteria bacterium]|nr:YajQ family cyclic di-GMP-binding protein [Gammaproteobacteria bacterium]